MTELSVRWKGREVLLALKNGEKHFCKISDVIEHGEMIMLEAVLNKTGMKVVFFLSELIKIEEIKDGWK